MKKELNTDVGQKELTQRDMYQYCIGEYLGNLTDRNVKIIYHIIRTMVHEQDE
ncbi:hypothetical protein V7101_20090 [Bacillus velezensis]|uniref:hypothetical protein n=1 Tax=Bacillus velezensis TaxID=492670 RepID=UPI002FFF6C57